jgi:hypothetical protein
MTEELQALEARLDALRASHAVLSARVARARARVRSGAPLGAFVRGFLCVALAGGALGALAVELARVLP